jgi:hypothetical protein
MASSVKDALALAQAAQTRASEQSRPAQSTSNYEDLFGPVETAGGHGDAYITKSPSGVEYAEYRPRGGGRVKRIPLTAVVALFPTITGESK